MEKNKLLLETRNTSLEFGDICKCVKIVKGHHCLLLPALAKVYKVQLQAYKCEQACMLAGRHARQGFAQSEKHDCTQTSASKVTHFLMRVH